MSASSAGVRGRGTMCSSPPRRKTRFSAVSGVSQRGIACAASMSSSSPSPSRATTVASGCCDVSCSSRPTAHHSSSTLSPQHMRPQRCGSASVGSLDSQSSNGSRCHTQPSSREER